jgi:hypothetical protein
MRVRFPSPAPISNWRNEINVFCDSRIIQNAKVRIKVRIRRSDFGLKLVKTFVSKAFYGAANLTGKNLTVFIETCPAQNGSAATIAGHDFF